MIQLTSLFAVFIFGILAAGAALAQSGAEARISNITLELTDLDLADGVTPSLSFYEQVPGPTAGWGIYDEHTGALTGDTQTGNGPLGSASVTESRIDLPHTRSDLSAGIAGESLAGKYLWASASMVDTVGANTSNAYVQSGNVWFVLSPHTRVTLSAELSVRSSAGPSAGPGLYAIGYASAALGLYASRENVWQSTPLYHNAVYSEDRGPGWDATYSLSFSNASGDSADYAMGVNVSAMAYTSPVIPAPVPEPASIAMLLAGLGLITARTRIRMGSYGAGVASGFPLSTTYTPTKRNVAPPLLRAPCTFPAGTTNASPAFTTRGASPSISSSASPSIT